MLGLTPKHGSRSKLAKHRRFQYRPRNYDPVIDDLKERRAHIRETLKEDKKATYFAPPTAKSFLSLGSKPLQLIGIAIAVFFCAFVFVKSQQEIQYLGKHSTLISIGGLIIFALIFIRMSKK